MYYKIGTTKQYQNFKKQYAQFLPENIWNALADRLKILDCCYGADRNIDADMGGYCVIFPSGTPLDIEEYYSILSKYHLQYGEWEYKDKLQAEGSLNTWVEELYLADNDFGIIFFRPISERKITK